MERFNTALVRSALVGFLVLLAGALLSGQDLLVAATLAAFWVAYTLSFVHGSYFSALLTLPALVAASYNGVYPNALVFGAGFFLLTTLGAYILRLRFKQLEDARRLDRVRYYLRDISTNGRGY